MLSCQFSTRKGRICASVIDVSLRFERRGTVAILITALCGVRVSVFVWGVSVLASRDEFYVDLAQYESSGYASLHQAAADCDIGPRTPRGIGIESCANGSNGAISNWRHAAGASP